MQQPTTRPQDPQRRQDDWFQRPAAPLQWEAPKRRADDFIPPDQPLDWNDEPEQQASQPES